MATASPFELARCFIGHAMPQLSESEIADLSPYRREAYYRAQRAVGQIEAFVAAETPLGLPQQDTSGVLRPLSGAGPIFLAAQEEAPDAIFSLLRLPGVSFDLNERGEDGSTPLLHLTHPKHQSLRHGLGAIYLELLKAGANPRACDLRGLSPIRAAIASGRSDFFEAYEQSPWASLPWVEPPLASAPNAFRFPHSLNAIPEDLDALALAAAFGRPEIVRSLLRLGANPNASNPSGLSALHCAGSPEVAAALLEKGADPFVLSAQGESVEQVYSTIVDVAARNATLAVLVKARAEAKGTQSREDEIQLDLFQALAENKFGVQWRKSRMVDLNKPTLDGRLLLSQAIINGDWKNAERLAARGASWTAVEATGASAASLLVAYATRGQKKKPFGDGAESVTRLALEPIFAAQAEWLRIRHPGLHAADASVAILDSLKDFEASCAFFNSFEGLLSAGARWPKGTKPGHFSHASGQLIRSVGELAGEFFTGADSLFLRGLMESRVAFALSANLAKETESHLVQHPKSSALIGRSESLPSPHGILVAINPGGRGDKMVPRVYPWAAQIAAAFIPMLAIHAPDNTVARGWFTCVDEFDDLTFDARLARAVAQSGAFSHPTHSKTLATRAPRFFAAVEQAHLALLVEQHSPQKHAQNAQRFGGIGSEKNARRL